MPKMKTKSAAKKRFKKVGGGSKIKRAQGYRRHLLTKKSAKRKRSLRKGAYISSADMHHIARLLPY
jgi:large subunit ribosomal protein L35